MLGNEIRLRPLRDKTNNTVVIADPLQTSLADGVIDAWQMYSTAVSLYHAVYLQVAFTSLYDGAVSVACVELAEQIASFSVSRNCGINRLFVKTPTSS